LVFRRLPPLARREALWGLAFLSPWLIGFLAFTLVPMLATFGFTFTNINLNQNEPLHFIGLENYRTLAGDSQVWTSLGITLKFGLLFLPVTLIIPLALAMLLNSRYVRIPGFFRTLFYMPYIVPLVASVLIWNGYLNAETGWLNEALRFLGVSNPPNWMNDTRWIYNSLIIIALWGIGSSMVVNLASLQGVPTELYDAAKVDGAGWWGSLANVTLPMISPVIFYNLMIGIVAVFQYFLVPLVLNEGTGEPGGATMFSNLYLYKTFFTFQDMSYGATQAWLLFVIILAITLVLFKTSKHWVYYAGETR